MADEKNAGDKTSPAPEKDPFIDVIWLLLILFIGFYIVSRVILIINELSMGKVSSSFFIRKLQEISLDLSNVFLLVKILEVVFFVICSFAIFYLYKKISGLRKIERKLLYPEIVKDDPQTNPQWERILAEIESQNENDWRLAIIEADIMLSGILDNLSLPGDTMGDKLKAVEKSDFTTIDLAWEAHKIRNQVAHEGESFQISQREAKRIIDIYGQVFEEFKII